MDYFLKNADGKQLYATTFPDDYDQLGDGTVARWAIEEALAKKVDLFGLDVAGIRLGAVQAKGASLVGCCFDGCSLFEANFSGADLTGSSFENADLRCVDFTGACMGHVNFSSADLSGTRTRGVVSFGPVGLSGRIGFVSMFNNQIMVTLGCFYDTVPAAVDAIAHKYGEHAFTEDMISMGQAYVGAVSALCRLPLTCYERN